MSFLSTCRTAWMCHRQFHRGIARIRELHPEKTTAQIFIELRQDLERSRGELAHYKELYGKACRKVATQRGWITRYRKGSNTFTLPESMTGFGICMPMSSVCRLLVLGIQRIGRLVVLAQSS